MVIYHWRVTICGRILGQSVVMATVVGGGGMMHDVGHERRAIRAGSGINPSVHKPFGAGRGEAGLMPVFLVTAVSLDALPIAVFASTSSPAWPAESLPKTKFEKEREVDVVLEPWPMGP